MEPKISLTDFVDFSIRNGTTRLTKIKQIKWRQDYHPSRDYWKSLRDGLAEFHEKEHEKSFLNTIVDHAPSHKK